MVFQDVTSYSKTKCHYILKYFVLITHCHENIKNILTTTNAYLITCIITLILILSFVFLFCWLLPCSFIHSIIHLLYSMNPSLVTDTAGCGTCQNSIYSIAKHNQFTLHIGSDTYNVTLYFNIYTFRC